MLQRILHHRSSRIFTLKLGGSQKGEKILTWPRRRAIPEEPAKVSGERGKEGMGSGLALDA